MKYDELKCHDCGKHLGTIIDTGPRGMSFCDQCADVVAGKPEEYSHWSDCSANCEHTEEACDCGGFHLPTWEKTMELAAYVSENLDTDRLGKLEKHQVAAKLRDMTVGSRRT